MIDCVPGTILPPPTDGRVARIESFYGITLPDDYRRFLTKANGGTPVHQAFRIGSNEKVVERFLPLLDDAKNDDRNGWADVAVVASQLDSRLASDPDGDNIDLIPIAALFAGDFLVLDYREGGDHPGVGIWDHEASSDFAPVVEKVSDSFSEFLDRLEK